MISLIVSYLIMLFPPYSKFYLTMHEIKNLCSLELGYLNFINTCALIFFSVSPLVLILFNFFLFLSLPVARGSSWARSCIGAAGAGLCHRHSNTRSGAVTVTYAAACGNAGSLTQLEGPGIAPTYSQRKLHPLSHNGNCTCFNSE